MNGSWPLECEAPLNATRAHHFASGAARAPVKPTILIAEDSSDAREMLGTLLSLKGYEVLSVENGVSAVEVACAHRPDLILLDWELPRLNGIAVIKTLRSRRDFRDTPMIIVSGHDPGTHLEAALAAGCTEYLLKPIDFDRLDAILELNASLTT